MSSLLTPASKQPALEPATFSQHEAAEFSRLSAKTLERHWKAGEHVGRMKIGRRVVYHRQTLAAWLVTKAAPVTTPNPAQ